MTTLYTSLLLPIPDDNWAVQRHERNNSDLDLHTRILVEAYIHLTPILLFQEYTEGKIFEAHTMGRYNIEYIVQGQQRTVCWLYSTDMSIF